MIEYKGRKWWRENRYGKVLQGEERRSYVEVATLGLGEHWETGVVTYYNIH